MNYDIVWERSQSISIAACSLDHNVVDLLMVWDALSCEKAATE